MHIRMGRNFVSISVRCCMTCISMSFYFLGVLGFLSHFLRSLFLFRRRLSRCLGGGIRRYFGILSRFRIAMFRISRGLLCWLGFSRLSISRFHLCWLRFSSFCGRSRFSRSIMPCTVIVVLSIVGVHACTRDCK